MLRLTATSRILPFPPAGGFGEVRVVELARGEDWRELFDAMLRRICELRKAERDETMLELKEAVEIADVWAAKADAGEVHGTLDLVLQRRMEAAMYADPPTGDDGDDPAPGDDTDLYDDDGDSPLEVGEK